MNYSEKDILQLIATKDSKRYGLVFRLYGERVKTYIFRVVCIKEDAEDLLQNTFISAFRHLDDYDRNRASLQTWITYIATNEIRAYYRHRQKATFVSLDDENQHCTISSDDEVDKWLNDTHEQRIDSLMKAIKLLSADEQMLIQLYYTDQQPLRDIAYILDEEHSDLPSDIRKVENRLAKRLQRIRMKLCAYMIKMKEDGKK